MGMKKISLCIGDEIDRALTVRAAEQGVVKAELIRSILGTAVVSSARIRPKAVGLVKGGQPSIARDVDVYLKATGFGDSLPLRE